MVSCQRSRGPGSVTRCPCLSVTRDNSVLASRRVLEVTCVPRREGGIWTGREDPPSQPSPHPRRPGMWVPTSPLQTSCASPDLSPQPPRPPSLFSASISFPCRDSAFHTTLPLLPISLLCHLPGLGTGLSEPQSPRVQNGSRGARGICAREGIEGALNARGLQVGGVVGGGGWGPGPVSGRERAGLSPGRGPGRGGPALREPHPGAMGTGHRRT